LNAVDEGLTIESDNAHLLKLKGDILKDLKNMSEAEKVIFVANLISSDILYYLQYYKKALTMSPNDGNIHINLGVLLHLRVN